MSANRDLHHQAKIGIACPHCGSPTRTRSSRAVSATCRQANLACTNEECGATYRAYVQLTHVISPPAVPNPSIELSISPPRKRAANDDDPARHDIPGGSEVPPAANDDDTPNQSDGRATG